MSTYKNVAVIGAGAIGAPVATVSLSVPFLKN